MIGNLHCGACMQSFGDMEELSRHLLTCPESGILSLIHSVVLANNDCIGHPASHFITSFKKAAEQNLIRKYAYAVADDLDILKRAELHIALCDCMGFPYAAFCPFESEKITTKLSREEALRVLCDALFDKGKLYLRQEAL